MPIPAPFYLDFQFWAAVIALLALVLSQLPPLYTFLQRGPLQIEVHSSVLVNHFVGNPWISLYIRIRNSRGREVRVRSMSFSFSSEGRNFVLPARDYYEKPKSTKSVLFVPVALKPGEAWGHSVVFGKSFDRPTDQKFRRANNAVINEINHAVATRPPDVKGKVEVSEEHAKLFLDMFEKMYVWEKGEYTIELTVTADPPTASVTKLYRFTLYESDEAQLRSHINEYKYGIAGQPSQYVEIPLTPNDASSKP